jgi:hypothetical protein
MHKNTMPNVARAGRTADEGCSPRIKRKAKRCPIPTPRYNMANALGFFRERSRHHWKNHIPEWMSPDRS